METKRDTSTFRLPPPRAAQLFLSDVHVLLKAFPVRVQRGGQPSRTKGYFLERGKAATNYEQLITLRWHFVEQRNTIKHAGWLSGGGLEGANSSLSMTK